MTVDDITLPVTVTLAEALFAAAGAQTARRIEDELSNLLRDLGVNATPVVEFRADAAPRRKQLIRVEVTGRSCRVPGTIIFEALAYVDGTPLVAEDLDAAAILARLGGPDEGGTARLGELTGLVYSLTPRPKEEAHLPWWKTPAGFGVAVLVLAVVLNVVFW